MRKQSLIMLSLLVVALLLMAACGGGTTPTPEPTEVLPTNTPAPTNTPVPTLDVASLTVDELQATVTALESQLAEIEASAQGAAGEAAESDVTQRVYYVERNLEEARALLEAAQAEDAEGEDAAAEDTPTEEAESEAMSDSAAALTLSGDFAEARDWSMDELEALDMMTATVAGPRDDDPEQEYTGISLAAFLEAAGLGEDAATLVATAGDGFAVEIDLAAARDCENCMLVVDEDGSLWLIMPGFPSNNWVRGLASLAAE